MRIRTRICKTNTYKLRETFAIAKSGPSRPGDGLKFLILSKHSVLRPWSHRVVALTLTAALTVSTGQPLSAFSPTPASPPRLSSLPFITSQALAEALESFYRKSFHISRLGQILKTFWAQSTAEPFLPAGLSEPLFFADHAARPPIPISNGFGVGAFLKEFVEPKNGIDVLSSYLRGDAQAQARLEADAPFRRKLIVTLDQTPSIAMPIDSLRGLHGFMVYLNQSVYLLFLAEEDEAVSGTIGSPGLWQLLAGGAKRIRVWDGVRAALYGLYPVTPKLRVPITVKKVQALYFEPDTNPFQTDRVALLKFRATSTTKGSLLAFSTTHPRVDHVALAHEGPDGQWISPKPLFPTSIRPTVYARVEPETTPADFEEGTSYRFVIHFSGEERDVLYPPNENLTWKGNPEEFRSQIDAKTLWSVVEEDYTQADLFYESIKALMGFLPNRDYQSAEQMLAAFKNMGTQMKPKIRRHFIEAAMMFIDLYLSKAPRREQWERAVVGWDSEIYASVSHEKDRNRDVWIEHAMEKFLLFPLRNVLSAAGTSDDNPARGWLRPQDRKGLLEAVRYAAASPLKKAIVQLPSSERNIEMVAIHLGGFRWLITVNKENPLLSSQRAMVSLPLESYALLSGEMPALDTGLRVKEVISGRHYEVNERDLPFGILLGASGVEIVRMRLFTRSAAREADQNPPEAKSKAASASPAAGTSNLTAFSQVVNLRSAIEKSMQSLIHWLPLILPPLQALRRLSAPPALLRAA
jgi:hypothetical protein